MPSTSSGACWNPAVPPPPVGGAAVGTGLADGLGVTDGEGLTVGDGDGLDVVDGDGLGVADGDGLGLAELLGEGEAVAEAPGEDEDEGVGSAPEDGDPEHAETVTEASTVRMPQPIAASVALSLVPAAALRTFMEPPRVRRPLAMPSGGGPRKRRGP